MKQVIGLSEIVLWSADKERVVPIACQGMMGRRLHVL